MSLHSFALEVVAVALLGAFLPYSGGFGGSAVGIGFAGLGGAGLVFSQALAQAVALLGADLVFADLDFGGVIDRAAPHAVAAHNQVIAVGQADFVQVIPTAFFLVALGPAAAKFSHLKRVNQQPARLQLAKYVVIV